MQARRFSSCVVLVLVRGEGGGPGGTRSPLTPSQGGNGDPCRIRTCDLPLRRPLLYPAELRDQFSLTACSLPQSDDLGFKLVVRFVEGFDFVGKDTD